MQFQPTVQSFKLVVICNTCLWSTRFLFFPKWYDGVCEIATKSPILLSTDPLNSELSFNFMIKSEAVQPSGMKLPLITFHVSEYCYIPKFNSSDKMVEWNFLYFTLNDAEVQDLRNHILNELDHPATISPLVGKLNFAHCTWLLAVYRLETLRVTHSPDPTR